MGAIPSRSLAEPVSLLDSCSMRMRRHWRHASGAMLLVLTLTSFYLYGQEGSENARTVIRKVQPQYPALAQRMSIKGTVKLEVEVEPNGSVKSMNAKRRTSSSGAGRARCHSKVEMAVRLA